MSKSYNNAIYLSDGPDEIRSKVSMMITDPQRMRRSDPGDPDVCNVFTFHKIYTDPARVAEIDKDCRSAKIGCVECKKIMAENLITGLAPIREKRAFYEEKPELVEEILFQGGEKARAVARQTMEQVRAAVKI